MPAKRTERAEWARRLEKWRRSGLDLRAYAAREGLALRSLAWWRWRLEHDAKSPATSTALMPIASDVSFVELKPELIANGSPIEIVLGNGRVVRVPHAFDDSSLARVLAVADGVA